MEKSSHKHSRGLWNTRLGFVLAASGSAVGLGNIWKFPYIVGQNGGGAFVLVYILCTIAVGLPIMLAEFTIGRKTSLNPVGAFQSLKPDTHWVKIGYMGVVAGFFILSFYTIPFSIFSLIHSFLGASPQTPTWLKEQKA